MSSGKFNATKEELKTELRTAIPEGYVTGNWRADNHLLATNLHFISVRISPEVLWDVYERNVGGEVAGSIADHHFSIHVFHSNCESGEPTCERGVYAQDVARRIMDHLLTVPVGFDIADLRKRESEPTRGGHRISRVIIEGTIHIKRID